MSTEIHAGTLGEIRRAGASKGVACTTTAAITGLPEGTHWISLTPRNFSGATVVKIALNPYLAIFKTTDLLVAAANYTEYSSEAQDDDTATLVTLSSLDTLANGDALYVGAPIQFSGVYCVVVAANSTASVLTVKYWNGTAWTDTSDTDGTIVATGKTMGQSGAVTWAVPSAWTANSLINIGDATLPHSSHLADTYMFWTRWEVSAALDSSTTLSSMLAMNRSTTYAELVNGQTMEQTILMGLGGFGCVESLTDAGTANLVINVATRSTSRRFA